ncbi:MAG: tRNA (adenosine(37)-N6)-threonylcarbamoyltransferase complex transferase subunit TsaD [Parcubacteria group bacterium]|nr:tRNA (adenosine(37)-N6)-threonylcarbamoyltransferase complex transferase subunit TsaD [Parcubacteria group bacterium]
MIILAIETSCDETAVAVVEGTGDIYESEMNIRSNVVHSQIDVHAPYGGVYPSLAKREHAKNLVPVCLRALDEAGYEMSESTLADAPEDVQENIEHILEREPELYAAMLDALPLARPDIDAIAVTHGPGLEPALWVGINFARALTTLWGLPIVPVNHMEGHILSGFSKGNTFPLGSHVVPFPSLALLVSGGHTELVLMHDLFSCTFIGGTRDDAVGEAFDKVARVLDLPYPGGPAISKLANDAPPRTDEDISFPRPMLHSGDYDFSFSGIKTSVLYAAKKFEALSETTKRVFAREFQDAVIEVLVKKTIAAAKEYNVHALILGGGVSANTALRDVFTQAVAEELPDISLHLPDKRATTDNAAMIGLSGYFRFLRGDTVDPEHVSAHGNLSLEE